jgi:hypothetical protein
MDRSQAIYLLKEIYDKIPDLCPQTVNLIESKSNDPPSPYYSIYFKGLFGDHIEQVIKIVKEYSLIVKVKDDEITISSPTTDKT